MEAALLDEGRQLAEEVYELIRTLDPAIWRRDLEDAARERLASVQRRAAALRERLEQLDPGTADQAAERFREAVLALVELVDSGMARANAAGMAEWRQLFTHLQPRYAALAARLRAAHVELPHLRPTNLRRTLLHLFSGLVVLVCMQYVLSPSASVLVATAFAICGWTMEIARWRSPEANDRIMSVWAPVAHGHEWHRVNSATWYCTALVILGVSAPPVIVTMAALVLAVSDPFAALVGRRFGRRKLVGNRTVAGTVAFALSGAVVGAGVVYAFGPALSGAGLAAVALAGGAAGAVAELFSQRLDDNLTIPLAVAAVAGPLVALLA